MKGWTRLGHSFGPGRLPRQDPLEHQLPTPVRLGDDRPQRPVRDRVTYDAWVRDGYIIATEGNVVDYDAIRQRVVEVGETYAVREIALDRWNAAQTAAQLEG